ncbi:MAG: DUF308 domain-containing protein [Bacteroidales bacterium]
MKSIFTIRKSTYGYVRAILALLVGLAFVIWPETSNTLILRILGFVLLIFGTTSIISSAKSTKKNKEKDIREFGDYLLNVSGAISILFGLIFIFSANHVINIISLIFGIGLILVGVDQLFAAIRLSKIKKVSLVIFLISAVLLITGIWITFRPDVLPKTLFTIFGIALIIYGVTDLRLTILFHKTVPYTDVSDKEIIND